VLSLEVPLTALSTMQGRDMAVASMLVSRFCADGEIVWCRVYRRAGCQSSCYDHAGGVQRLLQSIRVHSVVEGSASSAGQCEVGTKW